MKVFPEKSSSRDTVEDPARSELTGASEAKFRLPTMQAAGPAATVACDANVNSYTYYSTVQYCAENTLILLDLWKGSIVGWITIQ